MSDFVKKLLALTALFLLGLAVGRFTLPAKVVTKEVVKVEIREVEKKEINQKNDKVIVIIETKKPDGTVITESKIVDKSTVDTKSERTTETKSLSNKETTKEYAKNQYSLRVMVGKDLTNLAGPLVYGVGADKKFIGPINLGLYGFTNGVAGVSIGLTF